MCCCHLSNDLIYIQGDPTQSNYVLPILPSHYRGEDRGGKWKNARRKKGDVGVPDAELKHVYTELDFGKRTKYKLANEGIESVQELLDARAKLGEGYRRGLYASRLKAIDEFIRWTEFFQEQNGRRPDICKEFTEDALQDFLNSS